MSRTFRARWACALALVVAGCQDYNFNPVGHCLIQPGTRRVTLSNISSADVLFVVDDSGSMVAEQTKLAANFSTFINDLDAANATRAGAGLDPFDFHIAVTSTSVLWNYQTHAKPSGPYTCSSSCGAATGRQVCCRFDGTPAKQPKACASSAECTGLAGTTCGTNCQGLKGEGYCCAADGSFPVGSVAAEMPCGRTGTECGTFERHYDFSASCSPGVAVDEWPYPAGEFVSSTGGTSANPRVLHFDKELYTGTTNRQGFTRAQLVSFFGGNATVGTCGSGQEQALLAARRAIEKAVSGQQKDTYARTGTPAAQTWTPATRTAGSAADWMAPSASSKLVLVFVGDEDDCSAPVDPSAGVVILAEAGTDACQRDATTGAPLGQKQYAVTEFADFFMGLGRPVGAAFIFPAAQDSCSGEACSAGLCCGDCGFSGGVCQRNASCGAQAPGSRLRQTATELGARGADIVLGSICDPNFGQILKDIAELVKPPSGLTLPSVPAADEVTLLRIADASGQTRKVCSGPLQPQVPTNYTLQEAQATGKGWWFTVDGDPAPPTSGATQFVYINPSGGCIANPGETYSADYLGRLPEGGCWDDSQYTRQGDETAGDAMCRSILGGAAETWTCFSEGVAGACAPSVPSSGSPGTCICGSRANNCAP